MAGRSCESLLDLLQAQRPAIEAQLRARLRRTPRPAAASSSELYEELLGAFWIELRACEDPERDWPRALRRAWYLEHERPHRRALRRLPVELPSPTPARDDPARDAARRCRPGAADRLADLAPRGRLAVVRRGLALGRAGARVEVTAAALGLSGGEVFGDLRRRAARLHARAAVEGPTSDVRREARLLLRVLRMLALPPDLAEAARGLSKLAA